jgi:hypothetical protein
MSSIGDEKEKVMKNFYSHEISKLVINHWDIFCSEYENISEIKIGDNVVVYHNCSLWEGKVEDITEKSIFVNVDFSGLIKISIDCIGKGEIYKTA